MSAPVDTVVIRQEVEALEALPRTAPWLARMVVLAELVPALCDEIDRLREGGEW